MIYEAKLSHNLPSSNQITKNIESGLYSESIPFNVISKMVDEGMIITVPYSIQAQKVLTFIHHKINIDMLKRGINISDDDIIKYQPLLMDEKLVQKMHYFNVPVDDMIWLIPHVKCDTNLGNYVRQNFRFEDVEALAKRLGIDGEEGFVGSYLFKNFADYLPVIGRYSIAYNQDGNSIKSLFDSEILFRLKIRLHYESRKELIEKVIGFIKGKDVYFTPTSRYYTGGDRYLYNQVLKGNVIYYGNINNFKPLYLKDIWEQVENDVYSPTDPSQYVYSLEYIKEIAGLSSVFEIIYKQMERRVKQYDVEYVGRKTLIQPAVYIIQTVSNRKKINMPAELSGRKMVFATDSGYIKDERYLDKIIEEYNKDSNKRVWTIQIEAMMKHIITNANAGFDLDNL